MFSTSSARVQVAPLDSLSKVADIQPAILDDFGEVELLPWIGVGFALGTMTILPWGKAYGVFNIKWLYIFNVFLFEAGSAICGASPNMTVLIIARVIAGVGGCGMHSGCLTYIAVSTTMKERPMYMSGIAVLWGLGSVLGPVVFPAKFHCLDQSLRDVGRWGFCNE
jgi:MFS family permease